jgi:ABC-type nitrate/sulfonate/bicarbonate transport system permease component
VSATAKYQSRLAKLSLSALLGVLMWEIISRYVGREYFPQLASVIADLPLLLSSGSFWKAYLDTLTILVTSLVLGLVASLGIGLLLVSSDFLQRSISGLIDFIRYMPAVAMLPIFIATLGANVLTVIYLTAIVVTSKLTIYIVRGFDESQKEVLEFSKVVKLSLKLRLRNIYLPAAISNIALGLRLTAVIAYGTVVACGVAAGTPGIGSALLLAEESASHERIFSYVIVMGLTGLILNNLVTQVEQGIKALKLDMSTK